MGSGPEFAQLAAASAVGGGSLLYKALKNHKRLRKVADTPRSKVASAPQGYVELEGFAWPQGETVLTLDNEEAVYYSLVLQREETSGSGKNRRRYWVTVFNFDHVIPFYLLDPTGLATVMPHNSEKHVTNTNTKALSKLQPAARQRISELANGTVADLPLSGSGFFSGLRANKFRVTEHKILVGSPFYASGDFKTHTQNQLTIDDSLATFANKVINFESRSLKNVSRLLDKNGDGAICSSEAIAGYTTAARVSRSSPQKETAPLEVFGTLDSSENHKLFFADTHEHHLIEHLGRWQNLKISSGAALIAVAVCLGLLEFGLLVNPFEAKKAAERERASREQIELQEKQKHITALHNACTSGQGGFCRQLVEQKSELQLTDQHLKYYYEQGCRSGETSLCRQPASN